MKFIPNTGLLVVGCTYDTPAKCFNYKQGGLVIEEVNSLSKSCYTVDVSKDRKKLAMGDSNGNL